MAVNPLILRVQPEEVVSVAFKIPSNQSMSVIRLAIRCTFPRLPW